MDWLVFFIIILVFGSIISAWLLLKQSATKFNLSKEQLERINKRNEELEKQETDD